jgi:hypothetical protein
MRVSLRCSFNPQFLSVKSLAKGRARKKLHYLEVAMRFAGSRTGLWEESVFLRVM